MKFLKYEVILSVLLMMLISCGFGNEKTTKESKKEKQIVVKNANTNAEVDINEIKDRLCNTYPENLLLSYNLDALKLDIEPIDNGSGGTLGCKLKLFYGAKDYEYWEGGLSAWINQMADPFMQYNPDRNPSIYHKVEGLGDKAIFIANTCELQILKDGIVYSIVPPNNGYTTNSGKANKEIAIEIAKYYNL